jgi:APA family basic amino acid/polyamine antiporter
VPYAFSAAAQIKWRIADQKKMETARFARDMIVAVLSLVFSVLFIYYSRNTGHSFWVYWAPFFMTIGAFLLGIPVYQRQRKKMAEPGEVPEYR